MCNSSASTSSDTPSMGNEKAAHTPGPWYLTGKQTIRAGNGWIGKTNWNNGHANARLIAAAPDQHALLVEATDLVPRISGDDPMAPALADWCRKVRAAITKATGDAA